MAASRSRIAAAQGQRQPLQGLAAALVGGHLRKMDAVSNIRWVIHYPDISRWPSPAELG
jgi:hypothetical protein